MKKRYPFLSKTWLRFGLAPAFAMAFSLNLQAQTAPVKQWDKSLGGNDADNLWSLQQTSDGGYILGGNTASGIGGDKSEINKGGNDIWVVKIDANGNKQWDKDLGGSYNDNLSVIRQTMDGGFIIGGISASNIGGDKSENSKGLEDYWVIKLDSAGNKLWDRTFGGNTNDRLWDLKQTADGGYIVGGLSGSNISGDKTQGSRGSADYWVLKLNSNGNKVWDRTYGGNYTDGLSSLLQTSDGGYILGGSSNSDISGEKTQASRGGLDYWIIKINPNGAIQWDKVFGGSQGENLTSFQQTSDGGFFLGGRSNSPISGDKSQALKGNLDYWVVKLDGNGNKLWDKDFGGNKYNWLMSGHETLDGGYILGGYSDSDLSGDKTQPNKSIGPNKEEDYWLVKLTSTGNKVWDLTLGGESFDKLISTGLTSDGGYIAGGFSYSGISGNKTQANQGDTDMWVVKLGPDVLGTKENEATSPLSISPNPSNGKFTLQLSNLAAKTAEITVSDLLGREVLKQEIQITSNQLSEELTIPNVKGMYLLQLKTGEQILTRKIVVE